MISNWRSSLAPMVGTRFNARYYTRRQTGGFWFWHHAPFGIALTHKAIDNQLPGSRIFVIVILDSDSTIFLTMLIRTRARFLPAGRNAVINGALIDKNARIGDGL